MGTLYPDLGAHIVMNFAINVVATKSATVSHGRYLAAYIPIKYSFAFNLHVVPPMLRLGSHQN